MLRLHKEEDKGWGQLRGGRGVSYVSTVCEVCSGEGV